MRTIAVIAGLLAASGHPAAAQPTLTVIHAFDGALGATPQAGLIQGTDGNLYGTTYYGPYDPSDPADGGVGAVFRINQDTAGGFSNASTITLLHRFSLPSTKGVNTDGANPIARLLQVGTGTGGAPILFGTTSKGGSKAAGVLFESAPVATGGTNGYGETELFDFGGANGAKPLGALILGTDGNLYGTTSGGGANSLGVVFKCSTAGAYTVLHSFASADGTHPGGGVIQGSDGNFYGGTSAGTPSGYGTIFKLTSSGTFTVLHTFKGAPNDGMEVHDALVQASDGNLYGVGFDGGSYGNGILFQCTTSGTFAVIHNFNDPDGARPYGSPIQGTDGNLYGTTYEGGVGTPVGATSPAVGTVYQLQKDATGVFAPDSPEVVLSTFTVASGASTKGKFPYAGVIEASDGNLYGTTEYGGAGTDVFGNPNDYGVIFKQTP